MKRSQRSILSSFHRITFSDDLNRPICRNFCEKWPRPLKPKAFGIDILHDPLWNKSTAFDYSERERLGLRGLLPPTIRTIQSQVKRCYSHLKELPNDISKNLYLQDIHNRNETLYHRLLIEYIEELAPLVYTPTVGDVCEQFGFNFSRSRGMYFSQDDRGMFSAMIYNWPHDDVHVVVVTDGSRILGLGDLGAHGMGIPIGKLALYCAAGGIAPHRVLPVMLDVGTNNPRLLNEPDYVGVRRNRLEGDKYFDMVDEFICAVFDRWPNVVVQFEDFETSKAGPILEKYRNKYRVFNDDIQGTGCVTLSGLLSASKAAGKSITDLRVLCAGAGSAGLGVCSMIVDGMVVEGMTKDQALSQVAVCTDKGLIGKPDGVFNDPNYSRGFTVNRELLWANKDLSDGLSLLEAVKAFKPHVLLGLSAAGPIFTEEIIKAMSAYCDKPVIMPMSNPTSKAECSPEDAYRWSDNRAVVATGSPFPAYTSADGSKLVPSQCNNMYVFPGLGLAASVAGVSLITDKMLYKAAVACTNALTEDEIAEGRTFPKISRIREVSHAVACAIIEQALEDGLTTKITAKHQREGIASLVSRKMYFPDYRPLVDPRSYRG